MAGWEALDANDRGKTPMNQPLAPVDRKLLEILVAPVTHNPLRYDEAAQELISDADGLAFPIRDGIPIMLIDEARKLDSRGGKKKR